MSDTVSTLLSAVYLAYYTASDVAGGHAPGAPNTSMAVISYITAISYGVQSGQHHNVGPDDV